jgi:deoxyribodipyrimidine photo-lyase
MTDKYVLFWFRRDLRLEDNIGLHNAIQSGRKVICLFIFDRNILDKIETINDSRVNFIHNRVQIINNNLNKLNSSIIIKYGFIEQSMKEVFNEYNIECIYVNKDYEPYARERDNMVKKLAESRGIGFRSYKDQVIFEQNDILKKDETPYTIYTPYMKAWRNKLHKKDYTEYYTDLKQNNFAQIGKKEIPKLESMGFKKSKIIVPDYDISNKIIDNYAEYRDYPAINSTSNLGPHLRFGTVSIRHIIRKTINSDPKFVNELVWREFFMQILYHKPEVVDSCFKKKYNNIKWEIPDDKFDKWCNGLTGYPIVDAGMRQLKDTGDMHNRVRMITASFLCKHLLLDWKLGEAWFAKHLIDFDLAANNGNWQWCAGCGCDAAPYFRIFNPYEQTKKFDKDYTYIKKWVPEIGTDKYPEPIIEHRFARNRALDRYKKHLSQK